MGAVNTTQVITELGNSKRRPLLMTTLDEYRAMWSRIWATMSLSDNHIGHTRLPRWYVPFLIFPVSYIELLTLLILAPTLRYFSASRCNQRQFLTIPSLKPIAPDHTLATYLLLLLLKQEGVGTLAVWARHAWCISRTRGPGKRHQYDGVWFSCCCRHPFLSPHTRCNFLSFFLPHLRNSVILSAQHSSSNPHR